MPINWFRRKKKISPEQLSKVSLKEINYPSKIILAWAKAIDGNKEIQQWLLENGYEELYMACQAIYLRTEARDWLGENGYAHLLALINAAEGKESAQHWLLRNGFDLLYHVAMAVENEAASIDWLRKKGGPEILMLAHSIKQIKDQIEENHNDIHSFGKDL